jgi:hypothetical protein
MFSSDSLPDSQDSVDNQMIDATEDCSSPTVESWMDLDGNGTSESYVQFFDNNQDGSIDLAFAESDLDGDGTIETNLTVMDMDNDGQIDEEVLQQSDWDGDGHFEVIERIDFSTETTNSIPEASSQPTTNETSPPPQDFSQASTNGASLSPQAVTQPESIGNNFSTQQANLGNSNAPVEADYVDTDGDSYKETYFEAYDTNQDGRADVAVAYSDLNGDRVLDTGYLLEDKDGNGDFESIEELYLSNDTASPSATTTQPTSWENDGSSPQEAQEYCSVVGDVGDTENWHQQESDSSCAIASQEFILDDFGKSQGIDFTEEQLTQIAYDNGWYTPNSGTSMADMGKLLEAYGIPVERTTGASLDDLASRLDSGEKVMVAVDSDEIWSQGQDVTLDEYSESIPGQDANHAVQVVGIDYSGSEPMVILNDPGHPEGQGMRVPADEFVNAWNDSGNYMVATAVYTDSNANATVAVA